MTCFNTKNSTIKARAIKFELNYKKKTKKIEAFSE